MKSINSIIIHWTWYLRNLISINIYFSNNMMIFPFDLHWKLFKGFRYREARFETLLNAWKWSPFCIYEVKFYIAFLDYGSSKYKSGYCCRLIHNILSTILMQKVRKKGNFYFEIDLTSMIYVSELKFPFYYFYWKASND